MGVPAFFRWLSNKYPSIISHCVEAKTNIIENDDHNIDLNLPNPNGIEFDNLYLDMNGIIHPCCHPENKAAPTTLVDMMRAIFEYTDRIFNIIRPRKLIYFAVDGVAPRAKMNQQRSRRYRTARDNVIMADIIKSTRELVRSKGFTLPDEEEKLVFDSNAITPGTEFMAYISQALRQYIALRVNNNSGWQDIAVILSDASIPGEGEHKIMDFIRKQRVNPAYNPNLKHCIYGADADLIMLGLVTHEPNFVIIREEFKPSTAKPCIICHKHGHAAKDCTGINPDDPPAEDYSSTFVGLSTEFVFIRLNVLREYLEREFEIQTYRRKLDFEKCIDDWVLLCFLVGNDFLPHLPSLEIREGAIDNLVKIYKNRLETLDGYLSENGFVNFTNLKIILNDLGKKEDETFKNRAKREFFYNQRSKQAEASGTPDKMAKLDEVWKRDKFVSQPNDSLNSLSNTNTSNTSFSSDSNYPSNISMNSTGSRKRTYTERELDSTADQPTPAVYDPVRLGQDGWKFRYYSTKFKTTREDMDIRRSEVAREYLIGINWVLQYYYQGCPSWNWFYPFNYSPFASDCELVGSLPKMFQKSSKPFEPFDQLMAVLPPDSSNLVPLAYRSLMLSTDSPIIDFYPKSFLIDLNGKKFEWQGIALLPFIDENRLLKQLSKLKSTLDQEEQIRNSTLDAILVMRETHIIGEEIMKNSNEENFGKFLTLDKLNCTSLSGEVLIKNSRNLLILNPSFPMIEENTRDEDYVVSVDFRDPSVPENTIFESKLLDGAVLPKPCLKPTNYPRHKDYSPVVNFPDSAPTPFHLTLPAQRFIRHNIPTNNQNFRMPSPRFPPPVCFDRCPPPRFQNRSQYSRNPNEMNFPYFPPPHIQPRSVIDADCCYSPYSSISSVANPSENDLQTPNESSKHEKSPTYEDQNYEPNISPSFMGDYTPTSSDRLNRLNEKDSL